MLERLGRLCVGIGLIWVLGAVGWWLLVGFDRPEEWAPYLERAMSSEVRSTLHSVLTFVVTPIGMIMLLRDMFSDPEPLWLKLAAPGVFAAVYVLLLAAAAPEVGQPILLAADPIVARLMPGMVLSRSPAGSVSWLARFGGLLLVIAGIPGGIGLLVGLLTGSGRKH